MRPDATTVVCDGIAPGTPCSVANVATLGNTAQWRLGSTGWPGPDWFDRDVCPFCIALAAGYDPRQARPQRFRFSRRPLRNVVLWGDSVFEGYNGAGQRGFVPSVLDLYDNECHDAQPGLEPLWGWTSENWVLAGTWLAAASLPNSWDTWPVIRTGTTASRGATDASAVATWTRPAALNMAGFHIYWTLPVTAASAWSYRVDGGAWVNVPYTSPGAPELRREVVSASNPTTIEIRAKSAAGADGKMPCLHGIWPQRTEGTAVLNMGKAGARLDSSLGAPGASRSAHWRQWFTMNPADLVVFGLTNDSTVDPAAGLAAFMETELAWFNTQGTDVILVGQIEQNMAARIYQGAWRGAYRDMAARQKWGYIDMSARLGSFAQAQAAGYMRDNVHPNEVGGRLMASTLDRYMMGA